MAADAAQLPEDELRMTAEYRAAWDLELWKAVQLQKFQKTMREREHKANEQLKATCAQKEKEAAAVAERRLKEIAVKQAHLDEESAAQERRKHRLVEAEKELKRKFAEVEVLRKRLEQEADERVQRLKDECTHRVELCLLKQKSTEELLAKSDERQAASQKEYLTLWHEFADFKTRALADSGGLLGSQLDTLRTQHVTEVATMTERHERRLQEISMQHDKKCDELHSECRRLNAALIQKREHNKALVSEVQLLRAQRDEAVRESQHLRSQLDASERQRGGVQRRPSKEAMMDPEIGTLLRSIERQQANVEKALPVEGGRNLVSAPAAQAARGAEGSPLSKEIRTNIERWEGERGRLLRLAGGAYDNDSSVIQDLTRRIAQAYEALSSLQAVQK